MCANENRSEAFFGSWELLGIEKKDKIEFICQKLYYVFTPD
jgi:hypothetical protein